MASSTKTSPMGSKLLCGVLVWLCLQTQCVNTAADNVGGTIEIKFLSLRINCGSCKVLLTFCLSHKDHPDHQIHTCTHDVQESEGIRLENDAVNLASMDNIKGIPNPWGALAFEFEDPHFKLVTQVEEDKTFPVDMFSMNLGWTTTSGRDGASAPWTTRTMTAQGKFQATLEFQTRTFCNKNFYGSACAVKCISQDSPNGHYTCDPESGGKICMQGWEGADCTSDIDECNLNFCQHGACANQDGDYTCQCDEHFSGKNCTTMEDPCEEVPCKNQGTCLPESDVYEYTCDCTDQWEGETCETKVHPCDSNLCQNSATCIASTDLMSYTCQCTEHWQGERCEVKKNPCDDTPCENAGTCVPSGDLWSFSCECTELWKGELCQDKKLPCELEPCANGGTCIDNANFTAHTCDCPPMWEGHSCENKKNPCDSSPCKNGGSCTPDQDMTTFSCSCPTEWEGERCELRKDPCVFSPCQNGGSCRSSEDNTNYTCNCSEYYEGKNCESRKDPCDAKPCQNDGNCSAQDDHFDYTCSCSEDYEGNNCESRKDPCDVGPCQNGGSCSPQADKMNYTCSCPDEYEGKDCETKKDPCDRQPCLHGGLCQSDSQHSSYNCSCEYPYSGHNCSDIVRTTPDPTQGDADSLGQGDGSDSGSDSFQWWWIVLAAVVLVALLVLILVFVRRRRKPKKDVETIVVYDNGGAPLAFDNQMYSGNNGTTQINRQSSRDLPEVPTDCAPANGHANRTDPEYAEMGGTPGAVGGQSMDKPTTKELEEQEDLKDAGGIPSTSTAAAAGSASGSSARAQKNPYEDFETLTRESKKKREQELEEDDDPGYNDLDEIAMSMNSADQTPNSTDPDGYEVPRDILYPPTSTEANLVPPPRLERTDDPSPHDQTEAPSPQEETGSSSGEEDETQQQEDIASLRREVRESQKSSKA